MYGFFFAIKYYFHCLVNLKLTGILKNPKNNTMPKKKMDYKRCFHFLLKVSTLFVCTISAFLSFTTHFFISVSELL